MGARVEDVSFPGSEQVYAHMEKIIDRVILEKPKDAYGLVEVISRLIKEPPHQEPEAVESVEAALGARGEYAAKLKALDKVPADEAGEPMTLATAVPDFIEDADMFSWAGVGFSPKETYRIKCSLRALAAKEQDKNMSQLRFWGKIFGTDRDYYIAEAIADSAEEVEEEADMEKPGEGVNKYMFYATDDLCSEWTPLPSIKPEQIKASRKIKRLMSGNLQADVITHPAFPWKEATLLRSMIARITADTMLAISGSRVREDPDNPDESPIIDNPEFVCPSTEELRKQESWIHTRPHILRNGKTKHTVEEPDDPEEITPEIKKQLEEKKSDPERDEIRGIVGDGLQWVIKQAGDPMLYKDPFDASRKPVSNLVTFVRSLKWPGAVCATRAGYVGSLYVGNGLPAGEGDFFFCAPPDVQEEPEDPGEEEEPQAAPEEAEPAEDDGA